LKKLPCHSRPLTIKIWKKVHVKYKNNVNGFASYDVLIAALLRFCDKDQKKGADKAPWEEIKPWGLP
jgi:hypothetical protein